MLQLSSYWNSETAEEWNKHMTVDVHYGLSVFISQLSEKLLSTNCIKCTFPSGKECGVKNDMISSINLIGIVISLATSSVVNKTEGFPKLMSEALVTLENIIAQLKTLKAENCPAWRNMWKVYAIKAYNLGIHCNNAGLLHEAKEFFSQFCWTCIQLEEQPTSPETGKGLLGFGMQYLVQLYRDLKKYRRALSVIAVALKTLPDLKDKFLHQWVKIKNLALSEKHKNVQNLTVYDILQEDKAKIEIRAPNINLEEVNCPQLMLWELEAHSQQSHGREYPQGEVLPIGNMKINSMSELRRLAGVKNMGDAECPTLLDIEICSEQDDPRQRPNFGVKCKIFELDACQGIGKHGSEKESMRLFYIGSLYFWFFLCQVRVMRSKQEEEILQSNLIPTKIEAEQEDNPDPLQTCNVIPAYANLSLENESQLLETLNKAVGAWILSLVNGLDADEGVKSLPNIEVAAYMYELYGYDTLKLRTWCLYYKYAEVLDSKEAMLLALCHLLEWCTCGASECKWLEKAQELIITLQLEDNKEYNSQLLFHKYLLARCRHCYRNEQFSGIEEHLKRLIEYTKQEKLEHFSQSVLHVRVRLLIVQCMLLPRPHTITLPDRKSALNEASLTYSNALYLLKQIKMTPAENTEVLSLLLEISQWLGRLNLYLFWPREARCFMKGDLILSQKLGLTTRTAQFLNLLAHVDIMCCNVDDCQVKLQGIQFLLQLECRYQQYDAARKVQESAIDKELSSRLKQLTLDAMKLNQFRDSSIRNRNSPCGSPNLRKMKFVLPEFINHESDCKCGMCNIPALQTLVLDFTYIQAQLYRNQSELERALEFFEGGIQLYQQLLDLQKNIINKLIYEIEELTLDQSENKEYLSLLLHPLKLGYIHVTKSYADFLGASSSYDLALKVNSNALQEMQKLKMMYPHLAVDVMNQTLCIKQAKILAPATKKIEDEEEDQYASHIASANLQLADQFAKTPLNPSSSVVRIFPVPLSTCNSNEVDDRTVIGKPRKLFLPGGEDEIEDKENKGESSVKSVQNRIRVAKCNQPKQVTVYEDSPVTDKKTKPRNSNMKERKTVRTARKKTSPLTQRNLRSKRTITEHESLSKVCQALEFTIDSPVLKIPLSSKRKIKQKSCSKNIKSVNESESDLDMFCSDEIFCTETVTPVSKQRVTSNLNSTTSEIIQDMTVTKPSVTYSRMKKTHFSDRNAGNKMNISFSPERKDNCKKLQNDEKEDGKVEKLKLSHFVNIKETAKTKTKTKLTLYDGSEKISALTKRQVKGRENSNLSTSSVQQKQDGAFVTAMESLSLHSVEGLHDNEDNALKQVKEENSVGRTKNCASFLFSPSSTSNILDDTLVPESPPPKDTDVNKISIIVPSSSPEEKLSSPGSVPGGVRNFYLGARRDASAQLLITRLCTNMPGLNPKSLRSAYEEKAWSLLIVIRLLDGDIKSGSPLGAIRQE
ncbi:hypothetical protein ANN_11362 [Periplaneta americana]|uniref:Separase n=1 Tax=Periplaneta americana TaxID=6978 RepID=A0ABQ8T4T1_PERAM|nr:hypothetical protein ANN_11362 [Periplaneta americana]